MEECTKYIKLKEISRSVHRLFPMHHYPDTFSALLPYWVLECVHSFSSVRGKHKRSLGERQREGQREQERKRERDMRCVSLL
jgi:hypothetical protein